MSVYLVTVDVWDTLLRRPHHPEIVKVAMARRLLDQLGGWNGWGATDVYIERGRVESNLCARSSAAGNDEECKLDEVYSELIRRIRPRISGPAADRAAALMVDAEVSYEIANTTIDNGIVPLLQSYGDRRKIYLSDFYMPKPLLDRLLRHHHLIDFFDDGLVSCDVGLTKRSGRLFEFLYAKEQGSPQRHVHIGDNEYSDYEVPIRLGANAIWYAPEPEHSRRMERERAFVAPREGIFRSLKRKVLKS